MKRLNALALFAVILFVGCGGDSNSTTSPDPPRPCEAQSFGEVTFINNRALAQAVIEIVQGGQLVRQLTVAPANSTTVQLPQGGYRIDWIVGVNVGSLASVAGPFTQQITVPVCGTQSINL